MFDFKKIIDHLKSAAKSKRATYALVAVCLLEPIILPLFPDIIIAPILLSRPQEQLRTICIALFMTLLGCTISYCLSYFFGSIILGFLSQYIEHLEQIVANMSVHGTYLPFLGSILPMPFKVVCLSSGILKIPFHHFIIGILVGRSIRYSLPLLISYKKKVTPSVPESS